MFGYTAKMRSCEMYWWKSEDLQNSLLLVSGVCAILTAAPLAVWHSLQGYTRQCQETNDSCFALQKLFLGKYHGCQPGCVSIGGSSAGGRSRIAATVGAAWTISGSSLHFFLSSLLA